MWEELNVTNAVPPRSALLSRRVIRATVRVVHAIVGVFICLVYAIPIPLAWGQPASAPRVVLVAAPSASLLAVRVGQELSTMGFEPVLESLESDSVDGLGALARSRHAAVAVRIETVESSVRVWVFERITGKTLTRELRASTDEGEANPALHHLAIHIVELLRASLLELELADAPRGDLPPSPELLEASQVLIVPKAAPASGVEAAAAPVPNAAPLDAAANNGASVVGALGIELGAAWLKGAGDIESYPALQAALQVFLARDLRLGLVGLLPLGSADHVSATGRSQNRVTWLGLEGAWQGLDGAWRPFVGLGLGAAVLETRGTASTTEFEGETNRAVTAGALVRAGLGVQLTKHLQMKPQATIGVQSRYFAIDYGDRASARWGPWWGALSLALAGDFAE